MSKMSTVFELIESAAKSDSVILRDLILKHSDWTNEILCNSIRKTAKSLHQHFNINRGDVVAICIPNSVAYVIAFLAVGSLGAAAAPLNFDYKISEFEFYLSDSNAKHLIVDKTGIPDAEEVARKSQGQSISISALEINETPSNSSDWIELKRVSYINEKNRILQQLPFDTTNTSSIMSSSDDLSNSICLILHTSGTTSRPKAVPLTHLNLLTSISNIRETYHLTSNDKTLLVMPLFHVHGLIGVLLSTLGSGGLIVIPNKGKFSASTFWTDLNNNDITWVSAVPTIYSILLMAKAKEGTLVSPAKKGCLRFFRSSSSALPGPVLRQIEEMTGGIPLLESYSMTEASHQMTSNVISEQRVVGSVGKPRGKLQLALFDPTNPTQEIQTVGEVGEVCVKGPNVTNGYLNNPTANAQSFHGEGWFHTGDLGRLDNQGNLFIVGRIKELINRGGEKISPIEVDQCLLSHPKVAEAVTFAAPDPKYGEEVNAAVVLKTEGSTAGSGSTAGGGSNAGSCSTAGVDMEVELQEYCSERLARFKVPKRIFVLCELPKTATGKVQRRLVAASLIF